MKKKGGDGTLINTQQPSLRGWLKGKKQKKNEMPRILVWDLYT